VTRRNRTPRILAAAVIAALASATDERAAAEPPSVEPWRTELYNNWKALPVPPVTPYGSAFGQDPRAFLTKWLDWDKNDTAAQENFKPFGDYGHVGLGGGYDYRKDPRPVNEEFEKACLEDWDRMGYNCIYKGNYFSFLGGEFLKDKGLLGAIDQTLFGQMGPPQVQFDGKAEGPRQREGCGSFFAPENFNAGVKALTGMGTVYRKHLFTVKDHVLTCSWDEVGLREAPMDYRPPMKEEFRKYLKEVWFQDAAPGEDTNQDGRTYNAFTGETLTSWEQVEPVHVSLNWVKPAYDQVKKDGTRTFSAMPEVDKVIFEQPGRYKLLVDFHRYFTFEFFRRVNEAASQNVKQAGLPGRITCYPFVQHFIIWPGANQWHPNSFYWYHRLSPVVNVEHMWSEQPVMNLNYAITDRLAPRHKNTVMGWVWFYFGKEGALFFNGPHDMDRAMARMMGHNVDGTHHWLYTPIYRGRDQKQGKQIAYWQNFFKAHYPGFLSKAAPVKPQVALLMPDTSGYFYRYFQYPKQDFGWTAEAFQNLQYPWHLLTEEELELGETKLSDYKVLYVVGSEWSTPAIRQKIAAFLAQGGVVFANVDSLSLDVPTGKRIDFLEKHFGVKIDRKHKNSFYPSTQSVEEAVWAVPFDDWGGPFKLQSGHVFELDKAAGWAKLYKSGPDGTMIRDKDGKLVRDEENWKLLDAAMAKMPAEVRGLKQSPLDMRSPPVIRYAEGVSTVLPAATWGEVNEATPVGGAKPIAWWGDKVVGIETDNTVWFGTREGMSLHAIASRMNMAAATEPCNPFPSEIPDSYEGNRPYAETLGHAARKAGVTRPVTLTLDGKLPMNLEVLPRVDDKGTLMAVVISHDKTGGEYDVEVEAALVKQGAVAWEMLTEKELEKDTDGRFKVTVPNWGVSVILLGTPENIAPIQAVQAKLNKKDLSVPKYFADRPHLNEQEYGSPIPPVGQ